LERAIATVAARAREAVAAAAAGDDATALEAALRAATVTLRVTATTFRRTAAVATDAAAKLDALADTTAGYAAALTR
jgi:hypothetical protein